MQRIQTFSVMSTKQTSHSACEHGPLSHRADTNHLHVQWTLPSSAGLHPIVTVAHKFTLATSSVTWFVAKFETAYAVLVTNLDRWLVYLPCGSTTEINRVCFLCWITCCGSTRVRVETLSMWCLETWESFKYQCIYHSRPCDHFNFRSLLLNLPVQTLVVLRALGDWPW